jgi:hypothetical protein
MQQRHLTAKEIAEMLFGKEKGYAQRVHGELRELSRQGRVERLGNGGVGRPFQVPHKADTKYAVDCAVDYAAAGLELVADGQSRAIAKGMGTEMRRRDFAQLGQSVPRSLEGALAQQ